MKKKENNIFFDDLFNKGSSSLKGKYKFNWIEENVVFEKNKDGLPTIPQSNEHIGISFSFFSSRFFLIFLCCIFSFFYIRIFYLQIVQGDKYYMSSEGNRLRNIPILAERGLIFDRNDVQLTKNIPSFDLAIFPQDIPKNADERKKLVIHLSELTGREYQEIYELLEQYRHYTYESLVIQDDLGYNTALLAKIQSADLPGIHIQAGSKRLYVSSDSVSVTTTMPLSLSHIIGYQGKIGPNEWKILDKDKKSFSGLFEEGYLPSDLIGKTGIEKIYEKKLRGTFGKRQMEVDARGREQLLIAEEPPISGEHIKLTIDVVIQENLERIIQSHMDQSKKYRASGIVMNPQNGEILAMVSLPSFDNNHFSGGISQELYDGYIKNPNNPLFNRSIAGTYPSGSVVKPAIGSIALHEGLITPNTTFLSNGGLKLGSWFFPDWQAGGHGRSNLRRALAWSVNTFFYYIGGGYNEFVGLGVEKIAQSLKIFGLSQKLGIDLPGEASGFLPSKIWKEQVKGERWYVGDTYNLSIGQGDLLVTPLQIASMTSIIANDGTLYTPHVGEQPSKIIREDILDKSALRESRLGMRDCVIYGSCRRLSLLPFSTAGKTGTAQWSSLKENHAWFTSFAPFEHPEIVVTILVEEGEGGSKIAAPIAYDFYKWWGGYR
jgi:penicillin-binding protein 2